MNDLEYKDLLIGVWWDSDPGYFIARASEEFGRSTLPVKIRLPLDDSLFRDYADNLRKLSAQELQYVGTRLFDSLFQGDILRLYIHLREQMKPSGSGLRIRLRLEANEAARLPWECLYDTRNRSFLGTSPEVTLFRFVDAPHDQASRSLTGPLKVLVVGQAAEPEARDAIRREAEMVRRALAELAGERLVEVLEAGSELDQEPITRESLSSRVRDAHVVHWVAQFLLSGEDAVVGLAGESGGPDFIRADELGALLQKTESALLVLSGPEGVLRSGPALARGLVQGRMHALVTLSGFYPEDVGGRWTDAFYRALGHVQPVDAALASARADVGTHFPLESVWLAPALFTSRADARSFHNRSGSLGVYQLSEGRYRRKLRETLDRIWPKPERFTPLSLRWIPRQEESLGSLVAAAELVGKPAGAIEMARRFQRVLLLGDPGSGKTMTLYRLFYEAAESIFSYSAKAPLPYYVSLPDVPPGADLVEFLADGLDRELFESDLGEGRFLFLVDGLDGLSAAGAARSMSTLNNFMRSYSLNRFVLASRQPGLLPLNISTWAEFLPLTEWEAVNFLMEQSAMSAEQAKAVFHKLWSGMGPRAGNPQLLAMARRLFKEGGRIPESLTQAFSDFYEVAGRTLPPQVRDELLPALALFMTKKAATSLRPSEIEEEAEVRSSRFAEAWGSLRGPGETDVECLLSMLAKTRLLRGPHAFSFPNLALQEFLTARALMTLRLKELLDLVPSAEWVLLPTIDERPHNLRQSPFHGALPFVSGLLEESSTLILELADRDLLLASRCHREAANAHGALRPLRERIENDLASAEATRERVAALCLETIGDGWAVGLLEKVATDSQSSARKLALSALGSLHSAKSVSVLKAACADKNPDVRQTAQQALARLKVS